MDSFKKFFVYVWTGLIKPAAGSIWHVIGGAVTGAIAPTLIQSAMGGQLTLSGTVSTVVSGICGAIIGWAQHSNNQFVAQAAGQITPDVQKQIDDKVSQAVTTALQKAGTTTKALFLGFLLFALSGMAFAQDSILHYNGGLSLSQIPVTSRVDGDFLALGMNAGVVPLSFNNGVLSWTSNPILTVDYLFVKGYVEPSAQGLNLKAGWWVGPVIGAGEVQTGYVDVAHGVIGGTAGFDAGVGNLSLTGVVDLESNQFYFGPTANLSFDLGSFTLIQVH